MARLDGVALVDFNDLIARIYQSHVCYRIGRPDLKFFKALMASTWNNLYVFTSPGSNMPYHGTVHKMHVSSNGMTVPDQPYASMTSVYNVCGRHIHSVKIMAGSP